MTDTFTYSLTELAKRHTVTIDDPDRESGTPVIRKCIQLVRVEETNRTAAGLLALYDDGTVWECLDGSTAWDEVEMPK